MLGATLDALKGFNLGKCVVYSLHIVICCVPGYGECVLKVGTPLYHCTDGICYPLTYKLDGEGDCSDNSDEGKV